jgi:hypothetical protein
MSCIEKPGGFSDHVTITTESGKRITGHAQEVVALQKTWLLVRGCCGGPTLVNPDRIASIAVVSEATPNPSLTSHLRLYTAEV